MKLISNIRIVYTEASRKDSSADVNGICGSCAQTTIKKFIRANAGLVNF